MKVQELFESKKETTIDKEPDGWVINFREDGEVQGSTAHFDSKEEAIKFLKDEYGEELNEQERSFDEWVELTKLAAEQDEEGMEKLLGWSDEDTAFVMFAKEHAIRVGVPDNMIKDVAKAAADVLEV